MGQQALQLTHLGRHLEAFLEERGVGAGQLAAGSGLTPDQVAGLLAGERILTADVALLLGDFFDMSPLFWLELQCRCRLEARDGSEADEVMT